MIKFKLVSSLTAAMLFATTSVPAQDIQIDSLRRNIDIFSGVLEDALEINEDTGLFGMSLGGVESTYLYGQGVVLEVKSPLSSKRNRMTLASVSATIQTFQSRSSFATAPRPVLATSNAERSTQLSASSLDASTFYSEMMSQIASMDFTLQVNSAIRDALESARSLRSMGSLDEATFNQIRADLDAMHANIDQMSASLREVEADIDSASEQSATAEPMRAQLQSRIDELMAMLLPLRDQALAKASDLKQQYELAQREYVESWIADVDEFESRLYQTMCNYGSTLIELPANESISVILTDLGSDSEDSQRRDKVHVFAKADLLACQSGELDLATLRQRTTQYSY